jgi:hypothetical protein
MSSVDLFGFAVSTSVELPSFVGFSILWRVSFSFFLSLVFLFCALGISSFVGEDILSPAARPRYIGFYPFNENI